MCKSIHHNQKLQTLRLTIIITPDLLLSFASHAQSHERRLGFVDAFDSIATRLAQFESKVVLVMLGRASLLSVLGQM